MSRTTSPQQQAFDRACEKGDFPVLVEQARAALKEAFFRRQIEDEPMSLADLLAEHLDKPGGFTTALWDYHCSKMWAALAVGVALGQLVSPEFFTKDGGR